jgi:hypothetical protein
MTTVFVQTRQGMHVAWRMQIIKQVTTGRILSDVFQIQSVST